MARILDQGAVPTRFLFETDFATPADVRAMEREEVAPEPVITLGEHKAALAAAEAAAFERGLAQAQEQAQSVQQMESQLAQQRREDVLRDVLAKLDGALAQQEKRAVRLGLMAAHKFCQKLIAREPLGEVKAVLADCLAPLRKTPSMVIEVPLADSAALEEELDALMTRGGFEGRIKVVGSETAQRGDFRIEWPEGGIIREQSALARQLDEVMETYFAAKQAGAAGLTRETDEVRA
ncbi:FliH/SctL family protein [Polycladidibacter hongkongensis]|uniref:FliH/SctL family protein n=1 Tax=Polycladidibacter hongkongensis TaxID=1647556 RepID=UPI00082B2131|nr:FliH/SctL family protein [Pseudovibrio hongkongensis]